MKRFLPYIKFSPDSPYSIAYNPFLIESNCLQYRTGQLIIAFLETLKFYQTYLLRSIK